MKLDPGQVPGLEMPHIKDGIARLVVEMAKQEWPQQVITIVFYR